MDTTQHNLNMYNRYVQEYSDRFMDLALYGHTFDPLLEKLPAGARVLDLGCGPGNVIRYCTARRPDLQFLGTDGAPEMIRTAEKENPGTSFRLLDIREAGRLKERFHAVIASFCLPYLAPQDMPGLFQSLATLTADHGLVYLSCMEGPPERSGWEQTSFTGEHQLYISYYPRQEIESRLQQHGFTVLQCFMQDYPEADGSVTTDLIYLAQKRTAPLPGL
ncbi:MAG TPA: methyltransferase domain-containing protein [Chitinophagaceae bacterium]|nr:methyltransferase domain-containing protein [Chitinophagaceae bacterium]